MKNVSYKSDRPTLSPDVAARVEAMHDAARALIDVVGTGSVVLCVEGAFSALGELEPACAVLEEHGYARQAQLARQYASIGGVIVACLDNGYAVTSIAPAQTVGVA